MWTVPWYEDLLRLKGEIMSEVEVRLEGVRDKLVEASGEIATLVTTLRQQIADGEIKPETLDALDTLAQGLADIVPGSPPPVV